MSDDNRPSFQDEAARLADAARDRAADAVEEVKLASNQIVDRVRELIEDANVKRVTIQREGKVLLEIPLTVGVGAGAAALLLNPVLSAVGALAALVSDVTLVIERTPEAAAELDMERDAHDALEDKGIADAEAPVGNANDAADDSTDSAADKTVGRSDA